MNRGDIANGGTRPGHGADAVDAMVTERFLSESAVGEHGSPLHTDATERLVQLLFEVDPLLGEAEAQARARRLRVDLVGLGPIERQLARHGVTDVLVNGPGHIWVERDGQLERCVETLDRQGIDRAIERLVGPLGLRADRTNPIVDARLPDGTRVSVVLPPLAVDGPLVALRRHRPVPVPLERFADTEHLSALRNALGLRDNIVVYGATGSGKTTLVNAMLAEADPSERVVTIEDVAELRVPGDHVVRLEARPGSAEGVGRAAVRDLVRAALRLRPDRLVVGEVRGAEALDMVWALSTGHRGGISTCHASSGPGALRRLETMCRMADGSLPQASVRAQLLDAIDLLVGVARDADGQRRVAAVDALAADGSLRPIGGDHR